MRYRNAQEVHASAFQLAQILRCDKREWSRSHDRSPRRRTVSDAVGFLGSLVGEPLGQ